MEDIYALLAINKDVLLDFPLQAKRTVDHQTELTINHNMRTLQDIEERMMTDRTITVSQQTIDEIMMKVIENSKYENKDLKIWSIHELRIVSYYLIKLQGNEQAYLYALSILEANWRDMFFNGLSFYCLNSWNMIDSKLRTLTCELLDKKLKQYSGSNRKYMVMKNHANLFDDAGPVRLSTLLSQKKQDVKNAPMYFGNQLSTISQSYYSDVIVNFIKSNKITNFDYIETVLGLNKDDRTKKLVFANLVLSINEIGDEVQRTQLCKYANRILGDITLGSTWSPFAGATEKDAERLKKAKQLVNLWYKQKIIETFFEVCVQDRDRKDFWLKYVDYVSSFKIVGSTVTKRLLQGDNRVSGIFQSQFIETDSYSSQTSALVLFIKNKMIVEFSDTGALYVYNQNHPKVKLITKGKYHISNTADLKYTSINGLIDINDWGYNTYHEEGRMTHRGNWQGRLDGWLQHIVLSSNNINMSFQDIEDNDLFKANPILKEEFRPSSIFVQKNISDEIKKNSIVYESKVQFSISSKWIANGKCRIVCGYKGFYINIFRENQFVYLRPLISGTPPTGSIWIKRPRNENGWQEIVQSISSTEISVGYLKEVQDNILYKQILEQADFITVNI